MARVTITIEDTAPGQMAFQVESDPPYDTSGCSRPEPTMEELGAAVQRWSPAQAASFGAVMEMAGLTATFSLFIQDDPVI